MQNNINSLVVTYRESRNDDTFRALYEMLVNKELVKKLTYTHKLHESDVLTVIDDKLLALIEKFDGNGTFSHFFSTAVKHGCIDFIRKGKTIQKHEESIHSARKNKDGSLTSNMDKLDVETANSYDSDDLLRQVQKSPDQRQLIEALMENADDETRQSLEAYAVSYSFRKAATLLGVTDKTVKKRLRKLALNYDANRFGDIYEYFTVVTERAS